MSVVRQRFLITGRVQGVFFRQSTWQRACEIGGLLGWVRNLTDGRVEVLVEGQVIAVQQLAAFCQQGPRLAQVTRFEALPDSGSEPLQSFSIRA